MYENFAHSLVLLVSCENPLEGQNHKSTKPIPWNDHLEECFNILKKHVCSAPTLTLPDPSKPFEVETNASDYAVGAFLYQDGKPIAFESRKLDPTQCRYSVQENKLFAVIHALGTW